jgi:hypothetical protein
LRTLVFVGVEEGGSWCAGDELGAEAVGDDGGPDVPARHDDEREGVEPGRAAGSGDSLPLSLR